MNERFRNFTVLITKIYRAIRKIKSEETEKHGLTNAHVSCLYYLYKNDELTLKELMDICLEDKAALSRATSYLEKNGFITCDSNQKKRYNNFFKLTELGNKVAKSLSDKIDNILDLASDGFNNEEREVLYKCLTIISGNLDKICNDY